jgi:putative tricarboxylic transport membrane protein
MSSTTPASQTRPKHPRRLKSPQDFAAGLFLLAIAGVGFLGAWDLKSGTLGGLGPGLLPKAVAVLVAAFGVLLIIQAFMTEGHGLERWSVRGPLFVLGATMVFAWTIREWGLVVTGPVAVLIAACADKDVRLLEILPFAIVLTVFCTALFKFMLRLPIPLAPWYLGY